MGEDSQSAGSGLAAERSQASSLPLADSIQSQSLEVLLASASEPSLTEDIALTLLKRTGLTAEVVERLAKNRTLLQSRKLKLALVRHGKTPRHLSMPLIQHLFTFDLMQVALSSLTPADIRNTADEALVNRLGKLAYGEKISLARRASGRVAGELLRHPEPRVIDASLENGRLTEASVTRALLRPECSVTLVEAVCRHARWSVRREVRVALLRNEKTSLAKALEYARSLPPPILRDILHGSHLPAATKNLLLKEVESRSERRGV